MRFPTSEIAAHLGGKLVGPDVIVDGVSIDSRTIRPGQLFVPIVAERDGHAFVGAALAAGASAYLSATEPVGGTAVVVGDTAQALTRLGELARARLGRVVGITGSVGKTTTKDLVAACLASSFVTAASEGSFNNELGLPLTLLNAPEDARWVVLEMGARGPGHITDLARVARPDVGVVTRVAAAHVEFFGGLEGVARAKGELVAALPPTGVAVLNYDDPRVRAMGAASPCAVLGYAVHDDAEVRAEEVVLDDGLRPRFRLTSPWGSGEVELALCGEHQVPNALAAASVALWSGVPVQGVIESLARVRAPALRMEVHRVDGGPMLIADCYNANPASTEAASRSLAALPAARRLALLGVMAELGTETATAHRTVAALGAQLGIEVVGYQSDLYGSARVDTREAAIELLRSVGPGDAVLVKGSRVARLESVVRALVPSAGSPGGEGVTSAGQPRNAPSPD